MTLKHFILCLGVLAVAACAKTSEDELLKYGSSNESFTENALINKDITALWCTPSEPDADQPMTISFRAGKDSDLYGYEGDVYAHIGVIQFGVWTYVKANWPDSTKPESMVANNRADCKFVKDEVEPNLWHLSTIKNDGSGESVSVREYFNDAATPIGETPIAQIGIVIRSADGSKKGIEEDRFFKITDAKYKEFEPDGIDKASLPGHCIKDGKVNYGPNIDGNSITFVLHDLDTEGEYKDFAYIVGDFNDWKLSNNAGEGSAQNSEMYRDEANGCWWITISNLDPDKEYRYQYHIGDIITDGYATLRLSDVFSEKVLKGEEDKWVNYNSQIYPEDEMEFPAQGIDQVTCIKINRDSYTWSDFEIKNPESLVVYEMFLGDFTEERSIQGAMKKLDYLKALGINAIELMPVQEFDGNDSWGYSPTHYFALDKAYGTAKDYKDFIEACHQKGIAVIIDVVYNHNTGASPIAKLYWDSKNNNTASNNPYFNVRSPHGYNVFHDLNHNNEFVKELVKRSLKYLIEEYNVDGFRFDLCKGFAQSGDTDGYNAGRIAIVKDYNAFIKTVDPKCYVILEHLGTWSEENEYVRDGMHPWKKMNWHYCEAAMGNRSSFDNAFSDSSYEDASICPFLDGFGFTGWVGYMESHDEERAAYKARRWGSFATSSFSATDQASNINENIEARMNQLALNAVCFLTVPGPKMIWQKGELGFDYNKWCSPEGVDYTDSSESPKPYETSRKPVKWDYYDVPARKVLYDVYSKLNELRNKNPELFGLSANYTPDLDAWPLKTSYSESGSKKMQVYANFDGSGAGDKNIVIPGGTWRNYITGDSVSPGAYTLQKGKYLVLVSPDVQ